MKFAKYVQEYKPKIDNAIKEIYDRKIKIVKNSFLNDYYSELSDYFLAGGKRIRPLLCIATYNAFNATKDEKIIVPSVGTEFLHNASLVHDDIIDKDDFRRGNPAFHYRFRLYHEKYALKKMIAEDFGVNMGILGGDSAFFMGLEAYLFNEFEQDVNLAAIQHYEEVFKEVCDGVLIEIDMVNKKRLTLDDYIEMVSLKTGALIEKSMIIGATYARVKEQYKSLISTYGINLGIIFQIIDDILGTFGDEKVTGKPIDGDIREGKKTCLLIEAYDKLNEEKRTRLTRLIEKSAMSEQDVQEVKELFQEVEVSNSCRKLAQQYYEEAKDSLLKLEKVINPSEMEFFEDLLNFVIERKF
jgi:geranylgeranyl diphosphate synthase type I